MKLKVGKKTKEQPRSSVRQRHSADWQKPPSYSYHAQRAEREDATGRQSVSAVVKRHRLLSLQFWARRSGLMVVLIVALICLISVLSVSTSPRIVLLNDGDGTAAFHSTEDYQKTVQTYLATSFWNRNKVTVNTGASSVYLKQQYPELADVSVTLPLIGHRPIYYLKANTPAFVLQAVNGTYVLDSSGKALLAKASMSSSTSDTLPVITDQSGLHVTLGKQVISSDQAGFIRTVLAALTAKSVTTTSIVLPAGAAQELDVHITGQPYFVKFNMHDSSTARQQAGTYLATAATLTSQHIVPVQYIDVRVQGRAYYQ